MRMPPVYGPVKIKDKGCDAETVGPKKSMQHSKLGLISRGHCVCGVRAMHKARCHCDVLLMANDNALDVSFVNLGSYWIEML